MKKWVLQVVRIETTKQKEKMQETDNRQPGNGDIRKERFHQIKYSVIEFLEGVNHNELESLPTYSSFVFV